MTEKEAKSATLNWFNGDELATQVWLSKYALRNKKGELVEQFPLQRYQAIAKEMGRIESNFGGDGKKFEYEVLEALTLGVISPGGSGLYGIANPYSVSSLGNCFVVSGQGEDSYGSIMKTDEELVQIAKRRGGVGVDISHLRGEGSRVSNSAKSSSGAISFMHRFSNSTREVGQDGRRGALMLSMHVNHPDILKFTTIKRDITKVTGANVSIKITDEFMESVAQDKYHVLRYPVDKELPVKPFLHWDFKTELPKESIPEGFTVIKASELWNEIVKSNWIGAEPGLLYWDKIISESPADCYPNFQTESTNPCGELPLSPYDSCRLLSLNLVPLARNAFRKTATIDWDEFIYYIRLAIRMMDNIVELEIEKLKSIIEKIENDKESEFTKARELGLWNNILRNTINGRRLGTSCVGHGDLLASLGLAYDSDEGLELLENIHKIFRDESYKTSIQLAKERGPFPAWDYSKEATNPFLSRLPDNIKKDNAYYGRRNIALLTIPPTGSLAILLGITSGIEPAFNLWYNRRRKVNPEDSDKDLIVDDTGDSWEEYNVIHPGFKRWYEHVYEGSNHPPIEELTDEALQALASKSPYHNCTANDIDPIHKAKMQGTIQKYIDHSISATYNLPESITEEEISELYFAAWESGAKGCTIYREGSRSGVLINKKEENNEKFQYYDAPKRPKELPCDVFHPTINKERYVVLVGLYNNKPYEVFALKNTDVEIRQSMKHGYLVKKRSKVYKLVDDEGNVIEEDIISKFESPAWDFATRLISTALRHGADINYIIEQLNKANGFITDAYKVIARTLKKYLHVQEISKGKPCPQCGQDLVIEGGCEQCINESCGYGKCE